MAKTLEDVIKQLKENQNIEKDSDKELRAAVLELGKAIKGLTGNKNINKFDDLETSREKRFGRKDKQSAAAVGGGKPKSGLAGLGIGLGAAGAGLGAFFLSLAGAEAIISKFGDGGNFGKLLGNIGEGLAKFDGKGLIAIGGLLGAGALFGAVPIISGMGAGVGIAAIGLGVSAFFGALAGGDMAIGAMEATGKNLSTFMENIATGLGKLDNKELANIGVALGAGGGLGILFGTVKAFAAFTGMTALGAGIAGFFTALGVGDKLTQMMNVDGTGLAALVTNMSNAIGALDNDALIKVGGLLFGGGVLGILFGLKKGGGRLAGAGAIGLVAFALALGASLSAMAAVPEAANKIGFGTGESFKALLTNIGDAFIALEGDGFKFIAAAMAGGALAGFLGVGVAANVSAGIVLVGAAIGGFISSLAIVTKLPILLGVDGSSFKTIMTNIGEGLKPLNDLDSGLLGKVSALGLVGPAVASLVLGLGAKAGIDAAFTTFKKVWNFLTGADSTTNADDARKNQLVAIVESLKPLNDLDVNVANKMDTIAKSLTTFAGAIRTLAGVNINQFKKGFNQIAEGLASQIQVLDALANGGTLDKKGIFSYFRSPIDFKKGILDPGLKLNELTQQIAKAQFVLGQRDNPFVDMEGRGVALNEALNERRFADLLGGPDTIISAPDNSTTINNSNSQAIIAGDNQGFNPANVLQFRNFR